MEKKALNSSLESRVIVYDSGKGALSLFQKLQAVFPNVYLFSDIVNFPYGDKSFAVLKNIFIENLNSFHLQKDDVLILACNTMSCVVKEIGASCISCKVFNILDMALSYDLPLLCTQYTAKYLKSLNLNVETKELPGLAQLIEFNGDVASYLKDLSLSNGRYVYGCTHYPIVDSLFQLSHPKTLFFNPEEKFLSAIMMQIF